MIGYTLPVCVLGIVQIVICYIAAFITGLCRSYTFSIPSMLVSMVLLVPSLLLFTGIGILFGSSVNEKAAPGLCSIIISVTGMIGGIWMDVDGLGGTIKKVAEVVPFYHGVKLARFPFGESMKGMSVHLIWTLVFGILFYVLAVIVFTSKIKKDIK